MGGSTGDKRGKGEDKGKGEDTNEGKGEDGDSDGEDGDSDRDSDGDSDGDGEDGNWEDERSFSKISKFIFILALISSGVVNLFPIIIKSINLYNKVIYFLIYKIFIISIYKYQFIIFNEW